MMLEYGGRKKPEYKGCLIKRWNPNYKISNILDENLELREKNDGRLEDVKESDIASWGKIHRDGYYDDFHNEAPCIEKNKVEGDYLCMGYCKTKGKILITPTVDLKNMTMGVWEISWEDKDGKPADYWRGMGQLTENLSDKDKPGYHKTDRSVADIVHQFPRCKDRGEIKVVDENGEVCWKDFERAKKDCYVSDSESNSVNQQFWEKVNTKQKVEFVDSKTITNDKNTFKNIMDMIKTLKGNHVLKNNEDAFPVGKVSFGNKYSYELYTAAAVQFMNGIYDPIMVCKVMGTNVKPKDIKTARKKHRNYFENDNESFRTDARMWIELLGGDIKELKKFQPSIVYIPQCSGEKEKFYETKELF